MKIEAHKPVYTSQPTQCEWCHASDPGVLKPSPHGNFFLEFVNGAGNLCPHCVAKLLRYLDYWTGNRGR